ncbi:hypothetical protein TRFO_21573 [Tritrichomonas foetus]|uniref:TPR Domain containing protein n=1 Tax=Tritrichomonas foetus TaxID=1144522 RepID=A0A1J4KIJ9_9EUKA|nr:hypothetical protein TRFO_21573 [Tritrichomonas foetus]|eukprot:OHT09526.1 hypothetical protein TRFO_21573 [Tritrichomonas foetus]
MDEGKSRLRKNPRYFSDKCDTETRPGDEIEPRYQLKPEIRWERLQMINSRMYSSDQITAFTLAHKAEAMFESNSITMALEFAHRALKLDPLCADAFRIIIHIMLIIPQLDCDTVICLIRELIFTFRNLIYDELLFDHPGEGLQVYQLRSYIRILVDLSQIALTSEKYEIAVYAYEEALRVDNEDYSQARDFLILMYLKNIGRTRRSQKAMVDRTIDDLKSLIDCTLPKSDGPLFKGDENTLVMRWMKMMLAYMDGNKELFKNLARKEERKNSEIIKVIFNEKKPEFMNDNESKKYCIALTNTLIDWPDFLIDLHTFLRSEDQDFNNKCNKLASTILEDVSRDARVQMASMGSDFLDRGRSAHRNGNFFKAISFFTMAKRYIVEAMKPSQRWYPSAPFAIVSNRAACAERITLWMLARHDTRFTLLMQPDHVRSYERLPKIAAALYAYSLQKEFEDLVKTVKRDINRPWAEWKQLSRIAVGLLSFTAIIHSRLGTLTDEIRERVIATGIEDMYTSCNSPPNIMEPLPWLDESDVEEI